MIDNIIFTNSAAEEFISQKDFGSAARILLEDQKKNWTQLYEGYKSLETVKTRSFEFDGFKIKVQFNPGRIKSSAAKVDPKSIKERRCFLCFENLPPEQKGIIYNKEYLILCNPFPIFPEHFTLPDINHFPQEIKESFGTLLSFAKDLHRHYTVFYNGPKCGASAPDHLHFQAGSRNFMPFESEFDGLKNKYGEEIFSGRTLNVFGADDGLRRFISIEGKSFEDVSSAFDIFYGLYDSLISSGEEPMMNILSSYGEDTGWRVVIFLREKHRPSHYFAGGDDRILLSPASVDIGGVCITPLEEDFNKITSGKIVEIFKEVEIGKEYFEYIKASLKKELNRESSAG